MSFFIYNNLTFFSTLKLKFFQILLCYSHNHLNYYCMEKKLSVRENENLNLIMNLLKQTKYWERLSKLPQVRCGHLYTLINERIDLETEKGDEILTNRNARYKNGVIKYKWKDIKLRVIELTKDDVDFQILMFCYNIIWEFDYKFGHDLLGNYDV